MPSCSHCERKWTYGDTLKRSFRMKMVCPYCKGENYHSAKSRKKSMMTSVVLAPAIILFGTFTDLSLLAVIPVALALGLMVLAVTPFLTELSVEEESLW
ncbi:hypothetical protein CIL05_16365 [Virgibacillus profundi]|uniref:Cxxc_20_cxxc protein n=1 Tax=Virgibacillus profundi TaxID=2024555 RepID=A0A2A2I9V7_9BACI|nr:TIGR04104 family putative zinc finger protein [Virgibacillus profundi]PAV28509.1 hypothetical protein CIL05_16365 [Virgibacillus profundi]PXY52682.1 hypothetical protein CIT14_16510 [Virgibacillus profundi]